MSVSVSSSCVFCCRSRSFRQSVVDHRPFNTCCSSSLRVFKFFTGLHIQSRQYQLWIDVHLNPNEKRGETRQLQPEKKLNEMLFQWNCFEFLSSSKKMVLLSDRYFAKITSSASLQLILYCCCCIFTGECCLVCKFLILLLSSFCWGDSWLKSSQQLLLLLIVNNLYG